MEWNIYTFTYLIATMYLLVVNIVESGVKRHNPNPNQQIVYSLAFCKTESTRVAKS